MSGDFFNNLYTGIRNPDVVMNDGPLPPLSTSGGGYPAGFNGTPDGRINAASTLLGDLSPYSYAEADRLSTQAAFLNVPHRAQKIIPSVNLPEAQSFGSGGSFFRLSHQVDDGDVAFVIRGMFSPFELVSDKKRYNRQGVLYAVDAVVNLSTVNYILHGLQRYGYDKKSQKNWNTLWTALSLDEAFAGITGDGVKLSDVFQHLEDELANPELADKRGVTMCALNAWRRMLVDYLVKNIIRPFGVPSGSEKQGGQHQGSNAPITWPVDFVTTLTIDGLVRNLVNSWRHDDISAGDDLIMYVESKDHTEYVLSHHPKNMKKQAFGPLRAFPRVPCEIYEAVTTSKATKRRGPGIRAEAADGDDGGLARAMVVSGPSMLLGAKRRDLSSSDEESEDSSEDDEMHLGLKASFKSKKPMKKASRKAFARKGSTPVVMATAVHSTRDIGQVAMEGFFRFFDEKDVKPGAGAKNMTATEAIFQLVPGTLGSTATCSEAVRKAQWTNGYWHIARSQVMHFKYDQQVDISNGIHAGVRGKVLQATFEPVWMDGLEDDGTVSDSFAREDFPKMKALKNYTKRPLFPIDDVKKVKKHKPAPPMKRPLFPHSSASSSSASGGASRDSTGGGSSSSSSSASVKAPKPEVLALLRNALRDVEIWKQRLEVMEGTIIQPTIQQAVDFAVKYCRDAMKDERYPMDHVCKVAESVANILHGAYVTEMYAKDYELEGLREVIENAWKIINDRFGNPVSFECLDHPSQFDEIWKSARDSLGATVAEVHASGSPSLLGNLVTYGSSQVLHDIVDMYGSMYRTISNGGSFQGAASITSSLAVEIGHLGSGEGTFQEVQDSIDGLMDFVSAAQGTEQAPVDDDGTMDSAAKNILVSADKKHTLHTILLNIVATDALLAASELMYAPNDKISLAMERCGQVLENAKHMGQLVNDVSGGRAETVKAWGKAQELIAHVEACIESLKKGIDKGMLAKRMQKLNVLTNACTEQFNHIKQDVAVSSFLDAVPETGMPAKGSDARRYADWRRCIRVLEHGLRNMQVLNDSQQSLERSAMFYQAATSVVNRLKDDFDAALGQIEEVQVVNYGSTESAFAVFVNMLLTTGTQLTPKELEEKKKDLILFQDALHKASASLSLKKMGWNNDKNVHELMGELIQTGTRVKAAADEYVSRNFAERETLRKKALPVVEEGLAPTMPGKIKHVVAEFTADRLALKDVLPTKDGLEASALHEMKSVEDMSAKSWESLALVGPTSRLLTFGGDGKNSAASVSECLHKTRADMDKLEISALGRISDEAILKLKSADSEDALAKANEISESEAKLAVAIASGAPSSDVQAARSLFGIVASGVSMLTCVAGYGKKPGLEEASDVPKQMLEEAGQVKDAAIQDVNAGVVHVCEASVSGQGEQDLSKLGAMCLKAAEFVGEADAKEGLVVAGTKCSLHSSSGSTMELAQEVVRAASAAFESAPSASAIVECLGDEKAGFKEKRMSDLVLSKDQAGVIKLHARALYDSWQADPRGVASSLEKCIPKVERLWSSVGGNPSARDVSLADLKKSVAAMKENPVQSTAEQAVHEVVAACTAVSAAADSGIDELTASLDKLVLREIKDTEAALESSGMQPQQARDGASVVAIAMASSSPQDVMKNVSEEHVRRRDAVADKADELGLPSVVGSAIRNLPSFGLWHKSSRKEEAAEEHNALSVLVDAYAAAYTDKSSQPRKQILHRTFLEYGEALADLERRIKTEEDLVTQSKEAAAHILFKLLLGEAGMDAWVKAGIQNVETRKFLCRIMCRTFWEGLLHFEAVSYQIASTVLVEKSKQDVSKILLTLSNMQESMGWISMPSSADPSTAWNKMFGASNNNSFDNVFLSAWKDKDNKMLAMQGPYNEKIASIWFTPLLSMWGMHVRERKNAVFVSLLDGWKTNLYDIETCKKYFTTVQAKRDKMQVFDVFRTCAHAMVYCKDFTNEGLGEGMALNTCCLVNIASCLFVYLMNIAFNLKKEDKKWHSPWNLDAMKDQNKEIVKMHRRIVSAGVNMCIVAFVLRNRYDVIEKRQNMAEALETMCRIFLSVYAKDAVDDDAKIYPYDYTNVSGPSDPLQIHIDYCLKNPKACALEKQTANAISDLFAYKDEFSRKMMAVARNLYVFDVNNKTKGVPNIRAVNFKDAMFVMKENFPSSSGLHLQADDVMDVDGSSSRMKKVKAKLLSSKKK